MKELLRGHARPTERGGEDEIEIEKRKRRDEEVFLVDVAEMHRLDAFSLHQPGASDDHSHDEDQGEDGKVVLQGKAPSQTLRVSKTLRVSGLVGIVPQGLGARG